MTSFWNSDKLVGLTALLISVGTLVVFIYQTNLMREQQHMSVLPYLEFGNGATGTLNYEFMLMNNGIGPAFIRSVEVTAADGTTYSDIVYYVEDQFEADSVDYYHANLWEGRLIKAGDKVIVIGLITPQLAEDYGLEPPMNSTEGSIELYQFLNNEEVHIEVTYESIYGDRWKLVHHAGRPQKVD